MSIHNPPPIPLILVSHLPSASSFYAAITQPLGIRYLSASTTFPATLTFGLLTPSAPLPLFALTQSPYPQITPQNIHLPASTPKQVTDFYSKSRLLNPGCRETGIVDAEVEGGRCVRTRDLDGHFLTATYVPPGSVIGGGGVEGASTVKEARRVLQWQKDVAKSTSGAGDNNEGAEGPAARGVQRADTFPGNIPMRLVRRETVTEHYTTSPPADTTSNSAAGGGISGKAIIGTILGAAAGAAVAYAMVRSEAPDPLPRTSQTPNFKPTLGQRSATYSHPHPIPIYPPHAPTIEVRPARSTVSNRDRDADEGRRQKYIRYAIAPAPTPPPTGLVRDDFVDGGVGVRMIDNVGASSGGGGEGSRVSVRSKASARSRSEYPPDASARSRAMERERDIAVAEDDSRSHVSHKSKRSSTTRARSHVSRREEKEINIQEEEDDDRRSSISHRSHRHRDRKPERGEASEAGSQSYASARTHASDSTIKASRRKSTSSRAGGERERERDRERGGNTIINIVGRDGERVIDLRSSPPVSGSHHGGGRSRSHVSAREVPLPRSVVSARDVPLPASVAGSHRFGGGGASYVGRGVRGRGVEEEGESDDDGYGGYGGGLNRAGYAGSVAPSDSVSSVGIKRERERLRDRMRVRGDGY